MGNKLDIGGKIPNRRYVMRPSLRSSVGSTTLSVYVGDIVAGKGKGYYIVINSKGYNDLQLMKLDRNNGKYSLPKQAPEWFTSNKRLDDTEEVFIRAHVKHLYPAIRCGAKRSWGEYREFFDKYWPYEQYEVDCTDHLAITRIKDPIWEQGKIREQLLANLLL